MRNVLINILLATACISSVACLAVYAILVMNLTQLQFQLKQDIPISYPEEIQAVRAGDTLYVSSVSDSIYIGFKHK
jgi:hypothetical protein